MRFGGIFLDHHLLNCFLSLPLYTLTSFGVLPVLLPALSLSLSLCVLREPDFSFGAFCSPLQTDHHQLGWSVSRANERLRTSMLLFLCKKKRAFEAFFTHTHTHTFSPLKSSELIYKISIIHVQKRRNGQVCVGDCVVKFSFFYTHKSLGILTSTNFVDLLLTLFLNTLPKERKAKKQQDRKLIANDYHQ